MPRFAPDFALQAAAARGDLLAQQQLQVMVRSFERKQSSSPRRR
eukprot:CAMPEP_0181236620 /NCGR_PEP_ID=MMETSP1096-20121128/38285_1 /TAXON_ID=156174 ORGANISM="Chrysochromulina ericina, Strain CCMP281" /NCGR_SAMPLE_ID=MMETSP1096 /ASSEMBLY_ACC=CAM_ASM_000453 /LENGTH=43 /DNA_ID= /DNA_START= /DNA_END= /DNA_ORIENTATION=